MLKKFKTFAEEQKNNSFVNYCWSGRVVKRGKQAFAVFGSVAYDVSKMKFDVDESCRPGMGRLCVSINGRFLGAFPDEGNSGIMGLYIVNRRGKNVMSDPTFVRCGWVYTEELGLSADEISENITDEILEGKNVITTPPAGWNL